eukprot:TRINITY_DN1045_c0_g2_i1.p1 TRINITY_DN1045_c0_g2~~TRINITY_DN1045_c0_g2_i1.p1  ORF type:complete len:350 (-),score=59.29 TRINITY_DN1045_c0_g2_i1:352-1401(-)
MMIGGYLKIQSRVDQDGTVFVQLFEHILWFVVIQTSCKQHQGTADSVVDNRKRSNMSRIVFLFGLLAAVGAQSALDIAAEGLLPDGSAGSAIGQAIGALVDGTATVLLDDTTSASSVVLSAVGGDVPKPKPDPKPVPQPKPTKKDYYYPEPKCEDIYDDYCYDIKEYKKCGYCIVEKYPVKGYGCSYVEEIVMKKKADKKEYEYETVITPLCECEGTYIMDYEYCPSCDYLLADLLECAGITDPKKGEIEIPESCLVAVGATEDYLSKCGYYKPKKAGKKPVIVVDPIVEYKPIYTKKDDPKIKDPVVVVKPDYKKPVVAEASAVATASGAGAVASADAVAAVGGRKMN